MFEKLRSPRRRDLRPSLDPLEERALLNAAPLQLEGRVSAHVFAAKHHNLRQPQASDPNITILNKSKSAAIDLPISTDRTRATPRAPGP